MGNLIQTIIRVTELNMMKFFQLILIFGMFAAISSKSVNNVAEEDEGDEEEYYEDYYEEYNDEFYNLEDADDDEDEEYGDDEEGDEYGEEEEGEGYGSDEEYEYYYEYYDEK